MRALRRRWTPGRSSALLGALAGGLLAVHGCKAGPEVSERPFGEAGPRLQAAFPPLSERALHQLFEDTRSELRPDGGAVQQARTLRETVRFEPMEGAHWRVIQHLDALEAQPALEGAAHQLAAALGTAPLSMELGADGTFVRLIDADALQRAARVGVADPQAAEALAAALAPDVLEAEARAEWDARWAALLRTPLAVGEALDSVEAVTLPSGRRVGYGLERSVVGTRATPEGPALVLAIRCFADSSTPKRQQALDAARAIPGSEAPNPGVTCSGEQLALLRPFAPLAFSLHLEIPGVSPQASDGGASSPVPAAQGTVDQRLRTTQIE